MAQLQIAYLLRPETQERWLREQLQALLGWGIQEVLAEPQGDLIFAWPAERA